MQDRTDCEVNDCNIAKSLMRLMISSLLYAVCIEQDWNRNQHDHYKTQRGKDRRIREQELF